MSVLALRLGQVKNNIPGPLRETASNQAGVVSVAQALRADVSRDAIAWRVRRGHWQQLQRGVYALFSGTPERQAVLWAVLLRAGSGAMFSHHTAAELAGLIDQPGPLLHLTLPPDRRVTSLPGVVIHLSVRAGPACHPCLMPPRTRIEETVLDLAGAAASIDDACGWITRACGRRLTTALRLQGAMASRPAIRWRGPLGEVLAAAAEGANSVLEHHYRRDVERAHGLPPAARQFRVAQGCRTLYRDAVYRAFKVIVELDGRLAHPGQTRWLDVHRDNAAAADGHVTLRYGWADVTTRACLTAGQVASVLTSRGWPGTPRPCSPTCPLGAR
jgi:very-short-patch-repair endonuclease